MPDTIPWNTAELEKILDTIDDNLSQLPLHHPRLLYDQAYLACTEQAKRAQAERRVRLELVTMKELARMVLGLLVLVKIISEETAPNCRVLFEVSMEFLDKCGEKPTLLFEL